MRPPTNVHDALARCPVVRSDGTVPASDAAAARRRGRRGELIRVAPGAWVSADAWRTLWPEHRHAVLVIAAHSRRPRGSTLVSHLSAAALRGWAVDAPFPDRVHLTTTGEGARWANRTFVAHVEPNGLVPDPTGLERFGIAMTTGARTAVDLALGLPFRDGVAIADQALRVGVTRDDLRAELDRRPRRGAAKAAEVISFADAGAANVGESAMRVLFRDLGFPPPLTQFEFRDGSRTARVDFWFPDAGVIVEFDGRAKYTDPSMTAGRSGAEVFLDEKERENWLSSFAGTPKILRFGWSDRRRPEFVRRRCERAGIRVRARSAA